MATSVGQDLVRVDGRRKVTGAAKYAAEELPERVAHAVIVQATVARGRIASVDTAEARRAPGVLAVWTHENLPKLPLPPQTDSSPASSGKAGDERPPLSDGRVHYAGQHVAVVAADTLEQAQRAAALVKVRYREEPPSLDLLKAEPGATYPAKSFGRPLQHRRGDVDGALAEPGLVKVEASYHVPVETHHPMEPSATVAQWHGDRLTVWDATQAVVGTRGSLAQAFGIPPKHVRVLCPFTGGGFGCKGFQWPHTLLAAIAARELKRPVRLVLTRPQMATSVGHRAETVQRLTLAARKDGTLRALRHETLQSTATTTEFIEPCGLTTSKVLYACPNVAVPHKLVRLDVSPPTPMRAPGECPGSFALECAMDELAAALGMDPVQLRLKNHADRDPSDGKPWSSKHLRECYARGAELFGWAKRDPEPGSMRDGGVLLGWGMATALYPGYRRPASARIRMTPDGRALVQAATQDLGTGSYTVFTQVAADALGLAPGQVDFELGDTDFPEAPVSGGSATVASVSEAVVAAARALKAKAAAAAVAAGLPDGSPLAAVLAKAGALEAEATARPGGENTHSIHSWGAQFCEVRIDPLLPRVQVSRFVTVVDVGRVLNPRTARSQLLGGVTMGLGMALMEHTAYDPRSGRPVTDSFQDYLVPVNADVPDLQVDFAGEPDPVINSLGCRGIGEIGITGVAAAVANAVWHATGRRMRELPITPDRLL